MEIGARSGQARSCVHVIALSKTPDGCIAFAWTAATSALNG
jgi:hypothetical protein